jgi:hypothetical protein
MKMKWWSHITAIPTYDVKKRFVPKSDITPFEVAYILGNITGLGSLSYQILFTQNQWLNLEPQFKRHFDDVM